MEATPHFHTAWAKSWFLRIAEKCASQLSESVVAAIHKMADNEDEEWIADVPLVVSSRHETSSRSPFCCDNGTVSQRCSKPTSSQQFTG